MPPQTIAWTFLGASLSAYEQWLKHEDADLTATLTEALEMLSTLFARRRSLALEEQTGVATSAAPVPDAGV